MADDTQMVTLDPQGRPLPIMDAQTQALVQLDGSLATNAGGDPRVIQDASPDTSAIAPYLSSDGERFSLHFDQLSVRHGLDIQLSPALANIVDFDNRIDPATLWYKVPINPIVFAPTGNGLQIQSQKVSTLHRIQNAKRLEFRTSHIPLQPELSSSNSQVVHVLTDFVMPSYTSHGYFNFSSSTPSEETPDPMHALPQLSD